MKRIIRFTLITLTLGVLVGLASGAATGALNDTNGPSCRDITGGQFNYSQTSPTTYNLNAQVLLGPAGTTPACKQVTYTLYVIVDGSNPADAVAYAQDGSAQWLGIVVTDDDPDICVFATTSHSGKVFDTAPDAALGCLPITAGPVGGGGGFN